MHRRCGGGGARGSGGIRRVARGERDASLPERSRTAPNCSVEVGQCKGLLHGGRCSFSPVHVAHFVHSKAAAARKTLSLASLLPTALTGTPVRRDVPPSRAFHFSQIITYKFPVCLVFQKCAVLISDCGFLMMLGPVSLHLPGVSHICFVLLYNPNLSVVAAVLVSVCRPSGSALAWFRCL